MSKLLKQLVQVLDESGIQIENIDFEEILPGEKSITINKDVSITKWYIEYVVFSDVTKSIKRCRSLTEALDKVVMDLSRVKEGDILETFSDDYKVIKHHRFDLYNLLNEGTNRLLLDKGVKLNKIQKSIEEELFNLRR